METKQLSERLKSVSFRQFIYPTISAVTFILLAVLFIRAVRFLSAQADKPFAAAELITEADILALNTKDYERIVHKLNINSGVPLQNKPAFESSTPQDTDVETKSSLKIKITNSTNQEGAAGSLKTILAKAGFTIAEVDNTDLRESRTNIKIKSQTATRFPETFEELKTIIKKYYPEIVVTGLEETNAADIIIIIGG